MLLDGPGFYPQQQHKFNRRVCEYLSQVYQTIECNLTLCTEATNNDKFILQGDRTCYFCGSPSHFIRDCPNKFSGKLYAYFHYKFLSNSVLIMFLL